jgi:ATP-dependent DNA helicase DinG
MQCSCGFNIPYTKAPGDRKCITCGRPLQYVTDDFLLHQANGLVKEVRPGQITMGRLVESAIKNKGSAIIEGPVGIGKSFAYAIPSMLADKRIVISTAKKQLQHQLARKDLPRLAQALGKDVKIGLIKGKSNYACRVKAYDLPIDDGVEFNKWLNKSETQDITDLPNGKKPSYWMDVTAEDCIGVNCKHRAECGYWKSKQQMKAANIVVANHHVVAFDLRFGPFKILGPYGILIIDEVHQATSAFRGAYGLGISGFTVKRILRQIDKAGINSGLENALEKAWADMFYRVQNMEGEIPPDPFGSAGADAYNCIEEMLKHIRAEHGVGAGAEVDEDGDVVSKDPNFDMRTTMLVKTLTRTREALDLIKVPGDNIVCYVTTTDKKNKYVTAAPINVGPMIGPKLFTLDSVILTSATISINGSFSDIKSQMGMNWLQHEIPSDPLSKERVKLIEEAVLETPFDYNKQALLYTPKHIPVPVSGTMKTPERDAYVLTLTNEIARLIKSGSGNAFVLFSSLMDLKDTHQRLINMGIDEEYPLITQGDDAESALKRFLETPKSSILGVKSFWEGVDVVGDKLHLVIITKLPFPIYGDPVIQARSRIVQKEAMERGLNERNAQNEVFQTIQIPAMVTDLRQGAGRLIRSKTDKGVLAILDSRIWTGSAKRNATPDMKNYQGYGALAVSALGYSQKTSDFVLVDKFLRHLTKEEEKRVAAKKTGDQE